MSEFDDKFSSTQKSSSIIVNQTYSYINNTGFYSLANATYFDYYYRFARRYGWWYDRFVPDFHNAQQGYFSTGIAHAIVDGIANQIVGKKILLQNTGNEVDRDVANKTLKKAYKWCDNVDFTTKIRTAIKYAGAFGTSLLKANTKEGDIWVEALRFDDFFYKVGFTGELEEVVCLIKSYTDTRPRTVEWNDDYGENQKIYLQSKYYLVERRFYKEVKEEFNGKVIKHKVPYVIYQVHKYNGNITNAQSWDISLQSRLSVDRIPTEVLKSIGRDYSVVELGREQRLPFDKSLGCELLLYNGNDGSLSQQPFGQSILADIICDLMDYDLSFSYAMRDMYQGKGIVFMAKELQTAMSGLSTFQGLEDSLITWVNNWNDGKLPIEKAQFDLRIAEWRDKRNSIYETISTKLSISPSSLASFLSDNTARTAKEVSTESSSTDNYVEIERGCLAPAINRFLKIIKNYYLWEDNIEIKFAKAGSSNLDTLIEREIKLVAAGLRHPYSALRNIMIDADEWEIEEEWKRIQLYQVEKSKQQADIMFGMDFENNTKL